MIIFLVVIFIVTEVKCFFLCEDGSVCAPVPDLYLCLFVSQLLSYEQSAREVLLLEKERPWLSDTPPWLSVGRGANSKETRRKSFKSGPVL